MKQWLYKYMPIITTRWKRDDFASRYVKDAEYKLHGRYEQFIRFKDKSAWAAINPVIRSLWELRKNTWDKERVDQAIEWLEKNFEVVDDNSRHNP